MCCRQPSDEGCVPCPPVVRKCQKSVKEVMNAYLVNRKARSVPLARRESPIPALRSGMRRSVGAWMTLSCDGCYTELYAKS